MTPLLALSGPTLSTLGAPALVILLAAVLFIARIPRALRIVLTLALAYGILTVGFLQNPWFWRACNVRLDAKMIGWKQTDIIKTEVIRREDPWNARYLAVGSSQVWAVFRGVAAEDDRIRIFNLAGMNPLETYIYRDVVGRHCADTVVLYLSELDLARPNLVEGFKLTPTRTWGDLMEVTRVIWEGGEASPSDIVELWISNQVSLYRYQFVFRGILKYLTGEGKVFPRSDVSTTRPSPDALQLQIEEMSHLNDKWFDANVHALDRFVAWCGDRGLKVIIVEGDYHPAARAQNKALREDAVSRLRTVCETHANARFLSNEVVGVFAAKDYSDGTHVFLEPGRRFAQALLARIDGDGISVEPARAAN